MNLWSEFLTNRERPIHKWTHYFPIYERHFAGFVNRTATFIEIGVSKGGSLQLWKRFLGPFSQIVGIDIDPNCKTLEEDQIAIRIGDQSDPLFLKQVVDEFKQPDVMLGDGSHIMAHIATSFEFFYPRMSKNGVYMIEDLHTAYWQEYQGGLRRSGTLHRKVQEFYRRLECGTLARRITYFRVHQINSFHAFL
jgi:23S rRNA U2552 (ribose-2'-O)-methylase RlmE/FtsJ